MLTQLLVRNIALIDEITLTLGEGLHALTGETGAGKSLVVDAVTLLLGGKAERELIRQGADKAYVEGVFAVREDGALPELLASQELEIEDGFLTLSREISTSGRSVCRVSGCVTQLAFYKQVAELLMDLHGQHEHQYLMDERRHMGFLDAFGDDAHQALLARVRACYAEYHRLSREVARLEGEGARRAARVAELEKRERELAEAKLVPGEEEALAAERDRLRASDKIGRAFRAAQQAIAESALSSLREGLEAVKSVAGYDAAYESVRARLSDLYYEVEDVGFTLRDLHGDVEDDPQRLEEIGERLDILRRLSRKYGASVEDMLKTLESVRAELATFGTLDDDLSALKKQRDALLRDYDIAANALTASRRVIAGTLEGDMERQLSQLNMAGTRFVVAIERAKDAPDGKDDVRFLISPNKGEEPRSLSRIASGGELSRLMLALKSISAQRTLVPSMVFDEIDTGISGRTAQVVAEKLWDIARCRQVICVTHLQQIAAMASSQYLVEKGEENGRTVTRIRTLSPEERVREISRMLGGVREGSESSLAHAKALLAEAAEYRAGEASR